MILDKLHVFGPIWHCRGIISFMTETFYLRFSSSSVQKEEIDLACDVRKQNQEALIQRAICAVTPSVHSS